MTAEKHSDFIQYKLAAMNVHAADTGQSEEVEEVAQGETTVELGFTSHNE